MSKGSVARETGQRTVELSRLSPTATRRTFTKRKSVWNAVCWRGISATRISSSSTKRGRCWVSCLEASKLLVLKQDCRSCPSMSCRASAPPGQRLEHSLVSCLRSASISEVIEVAPFLPRALMRKWTPIWVLAMAGDPAGLYVVRRDNRGNFLPKCP